MVVKSPGRTTVTVRMPDWAGSIAFRASSRSDRALSPASRAWHRHESDDVTRRKERRRHPIGFEHANRTPPDDLPSSRRLTRVDTSLQSRDADRACRNPQARRLPPGRGNPRIDRSEIGKAWKESQHEDAVVGSGMVLDHSVGAQPGPSRDIARDPARPPRRMRLEPRWASPRDEWLTWSRRGSRAHREDHRG